MNASSPGPVQPFVFVFSRAAHLFPDARGEGVERGDELANLSILPTCFRDVRMQARDDGSYDVGAARRAVQAVQAPNSMALGRSLSRNIDLGGMCSRVSEGPAQ